MAMQVLVTLPDAVYNRVARLAELTRREVVDLVAETVALALEPCVVAGETGPAVTALADAEVLALTTLQMRPADDRRLSALLQKQQAQVLTAREQAELATCMQRYQEGLLRKAQALHEAVRRGLRTPLEP